MGTFYGRIVPLEEDISPVSHHQSGLADSAGFNKRPEGTNVGKAEWELEP